MRWPERVWGSPKMPCCLSKSEVCGKNLGFDGVRLLAITQDSQLTPSVEMDLGMPRCLAALEHSYLLRIPLSALLDCSPKVPQESDASDLEPHERNSIP